MGEIDAFGKEELLKILKDRMEGFKEGLILKVKKEKLDMEQIKKYEVIPKEDLKLFYSEMFNFDQGTRMIDCKGNTWLVRTPNTEFPTIDRDGIFELFYKGDITSLKKIKEEEVKTLLKVDLIRHDDAFIYNGRKKYSVDIEPSQKAIEQWGDKAQHKIEDRMRNYRDRADNWYHKVKDKAKEESKWRGIL